jgi:hypothetical protein
MQFLKKEISFDRDAFKYNLSYAKSFEALQRSFLNANENENNISDDPNDEIDIKIESDKKEGVFTSNASTVLENIEIK